MKILAAITTITLCIVLTGCAIEQKTPDSELLIQKNPATDSPTFKTGGVNYIGSQNAEGTVDAYLGVPFAQPPVGELRWMPPLPLAVLEETILTQKFAPACMQGPHMVKWYKGVISSFGGDPETFPEPAVSEDCLYLNIWKPTDFSAGKKPGTLPVLVFIHGGSNKGGWSYEPNYIGKQMAKRGVIVVTVPYRVAALGFFAHPKLEQANFALLDQIAALRWVRDNIAALGGDPDNVTVSGESAGANDIEFLMASPMAKGLFQRVIHQSGGSSQLDRTNKKKYDRLGEQLVLKVLGSEYEGNFDSMRKVPAQTILSEVAEVYSDHYFDPVVDGHSVTMPLGKAVAQGRINKVDLLIGTNADEWTIYLDQDETVEGWLGKNLTENDAQAMRKLLQNDAPYKHESPRKHLDRMITAQNFVCPSLKLASAVANGGGQVWVYYFSKIRKGELAATMGAYHGAELPYVFDTHDDWLPTDDADRVLTKSVMNYWVQFMRSGNPNVVGLPEWPAYSKSGDPVQNLNTLIQPETHSSQMLCEILMP